MLLHNFQHYIEVPLTDKEIAYATDVGLSRSDVNSTYGDGTLDPHRLPNEIDVQGAIAELAFTKFYGLEWTGQLWTREEWLQKRSEGDVGPVQVKSVRKLHHKLIIRKTQGHLIDCPYVLVSLHALPIAILSGWCMGAYAIRPRFFNPTLPTPAWAVPRSALAPMETFEPSQFV